MLILLVRGNLVIEGIEVTTIPISWEKAHMEPLRLPADDIDPQGYVVFREVFQPKPKAGACLNCGATMFYSTNFMDFPMRISQQEACAGRMPAFDRRQQAPNYTPMSAIEEIERLRRKAYEYSYGVLGSLRCGLAGCGELASAYLAGAGYKACEKCGHWRKATEESCVYCRALAGRPVAPPPLASESDDPEGIPV